MAKGKNRERPKEEVKEEESLGLEPCPSSCSEDMKRSSVFEQRGVQNVFKIGVVVSQCQGNCHSKRAKRWSKRCRPWMLWTAWVCAPRTLNGSSSMCLGLRVSAFGVSSTVLGHSEHGSRAFQPVSSCFGCDPQERIYPQT